MIFMKDLYGVPMLIIEEDREIIVVVDHFGMRKVRLKKNTPEMISILAKKIEEGVISAEDIFTFFSA